MITSLHDRMPNSRCVRPIVLRAKCAGRNGTGVEAAVALDAARHEHARKRFVRRQLQVRIVLVVAQQDVVLGRALLDEVVLERQRLDDRVGDDDLEPGDLVEQRVGLRDRRRRRPR